MKIKEGLYNVYKPKGITTYKIIEIIKKFLPRKTKVGHGGTLDPFAEGVVVIGIGRKYTKKLNDILKNSKKEYIAEILLDKTSDTYDISGKVKEINPKKIPSYEEIKQTLSSFLGEIEQTPPPYSAVKVKGKRLCDLIREGKLTYEKAKELLKPKKVTIYNIELLEYNYPKLVIKVLCSSGTYIRSLAKDIGEKLGCGGVVSNLVRTKIDNFSVENSIKLQ